MLVDSYVPMAARKIKNARGWERDTDVIGTDVRKRSTKRGRAR